MAKRAPRIDGLLMFNDKPETRDVSGVPKTTPNTTPDAALAAHDRETASSRFFRPSIQASIQRTYTRPAPYRKSSAMTRNGLFPPTLFGAATVNSTSACYVRKKGAEGAPLPIDGLRLSSSQLTSPVTRVG